MVSWYVLFIISPVCLIVCVLAVFFPSVFFLAVFFLLFFFPLLVFLFFMLVKVDVVCASFVYGLWACFFISFVNFTA